MPVSALVVLDILQPYLYDLVLSRDSSWSDAGLSARLTGVLKSSLPERFQALVRVSGCGADQVSLAVYLDGDPILNISVGRRTNSLEEEFFSRYVES